MDKVNLRPEKLVEVKSDFSKEDINKLVKFFEILISIDKGLKEKEKTDKTPK